MLSILKGAAEKVTSGVSDVAKKVTDTLPLPELPTFSWLTWPGMSGLPTLSELGEVTFGNISKLFPDIDTGILKTILEYKEVLGEHLLVLLKLVGDKNVTSILMFALSVALPGTLVFAILSYVIGVEVTGLSEDTTDGCSRFTLTVWDKPGVSFVKRHCDEAYFCEIAGESVDIQTGVNTLLRMAGKNPTEFEQLEDHHSKGDEV